MLYRINPKVWDSNFGLQGVWTMRGFNRNSVLTLTWAGPCFNDDQILSFTSESSVEEVFFLRSEVLPLEGQLDLEEWM